MESSPIRNPSARRDLTAWNTQLPRINTEGKKNPGRAITKLQNDYSGLKKFMWKLFCSCDHLSVLTTDLSCFVRRFDKLQYPGLFSCLLEK